MTFIVATVIKNRRYIIRFVFDFGRKARFSPTRKIITLRGIIVRYIDFLTVFYRLFGNFVFLFRVVRIIRIESYGYIRTFIIQYERVFAYRFAYLSQRLAALGVCVKFESRAAEIFRHKSTRISVIDDFLRFFDVSSVHILFPESYGIFGFIFCRKRDILFRHNVGRRKVFAVCLPHSELMIRFRRSQTVYRRRYEFARFDVNRGFIHTAAV